MPGIDSFIALPLTDALKKKLDTDTKKIERTLFQKHGLSIKQSIESFEKFHDVLNEFYDSKSLDLERSCINKIISYNQEQKDFYKLSIKEKKLAKYVLDSFGDENKRLILNSAIYPQTISETLENCKLPKTSGYRTADSLVKNGLLIVDKTMLREGKRITKYRTIFDSLSINITKDELKISGRVMKKIINASSVIQTIS